MGVFDFICRKDEADAIQSFVFPLNLAVPTHCRHRKLAKPSHLVGLIEDPASHGLFVLQVDIWRREGKLERLSLFYIFIRIGLCSDKAGEGLCVIKW